jgi:hypothetical protein
VSHARTDGSSGVVAMSSQLFSQSCYLMLINRCFLRASHVYGILIFGVISLLRVCYTFRHQGDCIPRQQLSI